MKRYRTGTRWGVWLWSNVVLEGRLYLTPLHLLKAPRFAVMLHWIHSRDTQPDRHDHPVSFLSFVLRGFYIEERGASRKRRRVRRFNYIRAMDTHRIIYVEPGTLTACVVLPGRPRVWGFHTPNGWVPWTEYRAPSPSAD